MHKQVTRVLGSVAISLALSGGCDDGEATEPTGGDDGGAVVSDSSAGGGDSGSMGATCPTDDAAKPGSDCAGVVSCGDGLLCAVCCMEGFGDSLVCADESGTCAADAQPSSCDGPEDCGAGQQCCTSPGEPSSCVAEGSCAGSVACHDDGDCPLGATCKPGTVLSWWGFCK